jgi:hypothetical protein
MTIDENTDSLYELYVSEIRQSAHGSTVQFTFRIEGIEDSLHITFPYFATERFDEGVSKAARHLSIIADALAAEARA